MGFRRYRGPVTTLNQANYADLTVVIECTRCEHERAVNAWLLLKARKGIDAPLGKPVPGFYCRGCRHSVEAVISAPRARV